MSRHACAPSALKWWMHNAWLSGVAPGERAGRLAWARETVEALAPTDRDRTIIPMQIALAHQLAALGMNHALIAKDSLTRSRATRDSLAAMRCVTDMTRQYNTLQPLGGRGAGLTIAEAALRAPPPDVEFMDAAPDAFAIEGVGGADDTDIEDADTGASGAACGSDETDIGTPRVADPPGAGGRAPLPEDDGEALAIVLAATRRR